MTAMKTAMKTASTWLLRKSEAATQDNATGQRACGCFSVDARRIVVTVSARRRQIACKMPVHTDLAAQIGTVVLGAAGLIAGVLKHC